VQRFLDEVVRGTKTLMTRVELGGTLLVAVVGVLLSSREEGNKSSWAKCAPVRLVWAESAYGVSSPNSRSIHPSA